MSTDSSSIQSPILAASALACRRGERLLFKGVNLALRPGQIVWVRGNNGRGKTSLLRLLAGLAAPAEGEITWRGEPLRKVRAAHAAGLLYLAHANALKDDLNVNEALVFLAQVHGQVADEQATSQALRRFGLSSRRAAAVRTLSQGQKRRVALARLALQPAKALWILDEPYDALDAEGSIVVDELLTAHAAQGGSVVLTSHQHLAIAQPAPTSLVLDDHAAP